MGISIEAQSARDLEKHMKEIGPSEAVDRFLMRYAKIRVRRFYAFHLVLYFRWLARINRFAQNVLSGAQVDFSHFYLGLSGQKSKEKPEW